MKFLNFVIFVKFFNFVIKELFCTPPRPGPSARSRVARKLFRPGPPEDACARVAYGVHTRDLLTMWLPDEQLFSRSRLRCLERKTKPKNMRRPRPFGV